MKKNLGFRTIVLLIGALAIAIPVLAAAQSSSRIDFEARVSPSGGRPEPVRQMTFYLLRKSLEDIRVEASQTLPAPDLAKFVDGLDVSPELKAWMKKHQSVKLTGDDFTKNLTPEEIVGVPEFFKAYMAHNAAYRGIGFPEPKYKPNEAEKNPEKYKAQKEQYEAAVRKFIAGASDTVKGLDLELVGLNPYPRWLAMESKHRQALDARAVDLAQQRYVVARTDTDLDGRGSFAGLAPGTYWIGLLGAEAISGDIRERWDVPVTVRQGESTSVELANFNAVRSETAAENSTN